MKGGNERGKKYIKKKGKKCGEKEGNKVISGSKY